MILPSIQAIAIHYRMAFYGVLQPMELKALGNSELVTVVHIFGKDINKKQKELTRVGFEPTPPDGDQELGKLLLR